MFLEFYFFVLRWSDNLFVDDNIKEKTVFKRVFFGVLEKHQTIPFFWQDSNKKGPSTGFSSNKGKLPATYLVSLSSKRKKVEFNCFQRRYCMQVTGTSSQDHYQDSLKIVGTCFHLTAETISSALIVQRSTTNFFITSSH